MEGMAWNVTCRSRPPPEIIRFWTILVQFGPSGGQKTWQIVGSEHSKEMDGRNGPKFGKRVFPDHPILDQYWPLGSQKTKRNWGFRHSKENAWKECSEIWHASVSWSSSYTGKILVTTADDLFWVYFWLNDMHQIWGFKEFSGERMERIPWKEGVDVNFRLFALSPHQLVTGFMAVGGDCTITRNQSSYAPSQLETSLHCNDVSHWLGAYLDWSLPHWCFV